MISVNILGATVLAGGVGETSWVGSCLVSACW